MTTANKLSFTLVLKMNRNYDTGDASRNQQIIEEIKQRFTHRPIPGVEEINSIEFQFAEGPVEMEDGKPIHQPRNPYPTTPFPTTSGPGAPLIGKPATFPDTEDRSGSGSGSGSASPSS